MIGRANSHPSIEHLKAAARRAIKFGIQVGIRREQGLDDIAVESIKLAMGASCGRGRIGRAGEQTDFTDVVAGANNAGRLLPGNLSLPADLKNSRGDDEELRFGSPFRTSPGSSDRGFTLATNSAICPSSRASKRVMS